MKEKMYSFIAHPVNSSGTGEYIEHSITEKSAITLDEMLESYARFLSAIGYDLDGRELMLVGDEADTMSFDPAWGQEYLKDGANVNDDPQYINTIWK
jgi:hypothetical protein